MDQMISYGGVFQRKTRKWWKKIFHWIIEITLVNSYILYKLTRAEGQKPLPLQGYKDILINQLKQRALLVLDPNDPVKTPKRGRPSLDMNSRFEGNKHLIKYVKEDRRCVVCSKPPQKKRSNYVCTGCPEQPHLHPKDCFLAFHTPGRAGASGDNQRTPSSYCKYVHVLLRYFLPNWITPHLVGFVTPSLIGLPHIIGLCI